MRTKKLFLSIFIVIFVILLVIPNLGLFRERRNAHQIAQMENRAITTWPLTDIFGGKYYSQITDWYNDRFYDRRRVIRWWTRLYGQVFHQFISTEVIQGKEGYLFSPYNASTKMRDQELKMQALKRLREICENNKTRFVLFVAPHAEWALPELLPEKYVEDNLFGIEQSQKQLFDENGFERLSVNDEFAKIDFHERKTLYYPADFHWNKKGGLFASRIILHKLGLAQKVDLPVTYSTEKVTEEHYVRIVGIDPIIGRVSVPWSEDFTMEYTVDVCDADGTITSKNPHEHNYVSANGEAIFHNKKATHKVTILWLGDSFFWRMCPYLMQDVQTIIGCHNSNVEGNKKKIDLDDMIKRYRPDFVIYEKVGESLYGGVYARIFENVKLD